MRLLGFSIDGFGVFHDVALEGLPRGLIVFHGENEAGKSTMLAFINSVLFGFPHGHSQQKAYPALNGGQLGGRIFIETDNDGPISIERREGKKGGPVTISYADGRKEDEAAMQRLLGGITRKLYQNLYAFSLSELQELETLTSEEVKEVIYGASLGTGSPSLSEARKRLEKRLDELFRPRASTPEINQILKSLEEVRAQIHSGSKGIQEYVKLADELDSFDKEMEQSRGQLQGYRTRHERVKSLLQLWNDWVALQDTEARLSNLSDQVESFPQDGLTRLDALQQELKAHNEELRTAMEDLNEKQEKLNGLEFDQVLLDQEAEIRALVRGIGTYEQAVRERPVAEESVKATKQRADQVMAELGTGWTEERALALDRSSHVREEIATHRTSNLIAERNRERAGDTVQTCRDSLDKVRAQEALAQARVKELEDEGLDVDLGTLASLREGRAQFGDVLRDIPLRQVEREAAQTELERILREIDANWTMETLDRFDSSITARQRVDEFEACLSLAAMRVRDSEHTLRRAEETCAGLKYEVETKGETLGSAQANKADIVTLRARRVELRELREVVQKSESILSELQYREQFSRDRGEKASRDRGTVPPRRLLWAAAGSLVLGLILGPALWAAGFPAVGGTAAPVLILVAALLFMLSRGEQRSTFQGLEGTSGPADDQRTMELQKESVQLSIRLASLLKKLGIAGNIDASGVDRLEDENDRMLHEAEERARFRLELEELEKKLERASSARDVAARALKAAESELQSAKEEWRQFVSSVGLPGDSSPRSVGLVFAKTDTARGQAKQVQNLDRRLEEMASSRSAYLALMEKLPHLRVAASMDNAALFSELTEFFSEMDRREERAGQLEQARNVLAEAESHSAAAQEKLKNALEEEEEARQALAKRTDDWKAWLREHGMDQTWSPDTAVRAQDHASRLYELVVTRAEEATKVARCDAEIERFQSRTQDLYKALGRGTLPGDKLVAEVHRMESDLDEHTKRRTLHSSLSEEVPSLKQRCDNRRLQIDELKEEIKSLVAAGGASDEEDFRNRACSFEERRKLTERIAGLGSSLRTASGQADLDALKRELADASVVELRAEEADLGKRITDGEKQLESLVEKRTRAHEQQRNLYDLDHIAQLRSQEEKLLEGLRISSEDWGRYAVARHLLSAAKERFEQAHQPEVLQGASRYFTKITGGRYAQVFAPHDEAEMEVVDSKGSRKKLDALSRGTSEQLYLAIRFGYISTQNVIGGQLPVLMDDVLVNFDPGRASLAANGILEMAETRQVLFFTCHPETVQVFRTHAPEVPVFQIANGTVRLDGK